MNRNKQASTVSTHIRDQAPLYLGQKGSHFAHPPYAELHCVSNYSFLRGASHPEELVQQAYELGYAAVAITDECSYSGLVKAHKTAKACGIKLICGAEFVLSQKPALAPSNTAQTNAQQTIPEQPNTIKDNPSSRLILLAPNRKSYGQISSIISHSNICL